MVSLHDEPRPLNARCTITPVVALQIRVRGLCVKKGEHLGNDGIEEIPLCTGVCQPQIRMVLTKV